MRLICTLNDKRQADILSAFLKNQGIENEIDISIQTDWGSDQYGDVDCKIWVIDEDQFQAALAWANQYQKDPHNPIFLEQQTPHLYDDEIIIEPHHIQDKIIDAEKIVKTHIFTDEKIREKTLPNSSIGTITMWSLLMCIVMFIISVVTQPEITIKQLPSYLPSMPLITPQIKKTMLFDWPMTYQLTDELLLLYGIDKLEEPKRLPQDAIELIQTIQTTPYWQGFYPEIINWYQDAKANPNSSAPLFEKIRQGEVWRAITPIFLHSDILHLLFNMLWLIVLGKQIEERIGPRHYVFMILFAAVVSNTSQYLMSGSNFIGFSGVLCAFLAFIWCRQKHAPWEGYQVQETTINFMWFFIFSMFALQLISFITEATTNTALSPGIANTAHLSGAFSGYLLARLKS